MRLTTDQLNDRINRRIVVTRLAAHGGLEWIAKLSARMLHRYASELLRRERQEQPTHEPICS